MHLFEYISLILFPFEFYFNWKNWCLLATVYSWNKKKQRTKNNWAFLLFYTREVVHSSRLCLYIKVKWSGRSRAPSKVDAGHFIKPYVYWRFVYINKTSLQWIEKSVWGFVWAHDGLCTSMTTTCQSRWEFVYQCEYNISEEIVAYAPAWVQHFRAR